MWITTVNYDASMVRSMDNPGNAIDLFQQIRQKKDELQAVDGAGNFLPEFPEIPLDQVPVDATIITIKRAWNQQTHAQEFVDFVNQVAEFAVASIEEQV